MSPKTLAPRGGSPGAGAKMLCFSYPRYTQVFQFWQKGFAKVGNGVMIRMEAARKEVERHRLVGRPFNLAGTEGACGVAIKQQT